MDISWLTPVFEGAGPYATVHLDVSRDDENGEHEVGLRWRAAREQLAEAGAPAEVLDALEAVVPAPPDGGGRQSRTVIAAADATILLERDVPGGVIDSVTWGPAPDVVPLLRRLGGRPPYLLVVVDREGADIEVWGPADSTPRDTERVKGGNYPIRKVQVGGWAHLRYQHRAENLWRDNADAVITDIERLLAGSGARVLAVAGEQRMATLISDRIAERYKDAFVGLEHGGRAAGASREALEQELDALLAQTEANETGDVLDTYREERGRGAAAVEGVDAVCEALRKAQVRRLLLTDDIPEDATVFVGTQPVVLGISAEEVRSLGDEPTEVPLQSGLVRAAVGTDADVVFVPKEAEAIKDGVGAVLRYTDASTDSAS